MEIYTPTRPSLTLYTLKRDLIYKVCDCPEDIVIPHNDVKAWPLFPEYRWVYNKMAICRTQPTKNIKYAPVDVHPDIGDYPIIVKPIINLKGMGVGSRKISTQTEYDRMTTPSGYFWSTYFTGKHYSIDLLIQDGQILWSAVFQGHLSKPGLFKYWETVPFTDIPNHHRDHIRSWVNENLEGYTGCVNMETIGGTIIEVHLRMGDLSYLPNRKQIFQAIVELYGDREAEKDTDSSSTTDDQSLAEQLAPLTEKTYNIPIFIPSKWLSAPWCWLYNVKRVSMDDMIRACKDGSKVVDILQKDPIDSLSNPVGYVRVANLTCRDLKQGLEIRDALSALYKVQWMHLVTLFVAAVMIISYVL